MKRTWGWAALYLLYSSLLTWQDRWPLGKTSLICLLTTIAWAVVPGPPSERRSSEAHGAGVHPSELAKWVRTPSGWASVPSAYQPPVPGPIVQLPFPQFPPVVYDGTSMERGGYPAYPFPRPDFAREAVSFYRRPALQQSASSRFVEISNEEPVARRTRSWRSTASVATATVPISRSSSRTRFSIAPSDTESEAEQLVAGVGPPCIAPSLSCSQSGNLQARREQLGCTREIFRPAHSVRGFNASAVKGVSGSVQTMIVRF